MSQRRELKLALDDVSDVVVPLEVRSHLMDRFPHIKVDPEMIVVPQDAGEGDPSELVSTKGAKGGLSGGRLGKRDRKLEKARIKKQLDKMLGEQIEIPLIIGGEEVSQQEVRTRPTMQAYGEMFARYDLHAYDFRPAVPDIDEELARVMGVEFGRGLSCGPVRIREPEPVAARTRCPIEIMCDHDWKAPRAPNTGQESHGVYAVVKTAWVLWDDAPEDLWQFFRRLSSTPDLLQQVLLANADTFEFPGRLSKLTSLIEGSAEDDRLSASLGAYLVSGVPLERLLDLSPGQQGRECFAYSPLSTVSGLGLWAKNVGSRLPSLLVRGMRSVTPDLQWLETWSSLISVLGTLESALPEERATVRSMAVKARARLRQIQREEAAHGMAEKTYCGLARKRKRGTKQKKKKKRKKRRSGR